MFRKRASHLALLAVFGGAAFSGGALAQIATDGSVGAARALAGPGYAITPDLGRQVGANLFHSFSAFNLANGESATFSGPGSVGHIISRVTGGAASSIDGLLRSTIPGAHLYLINPRGILFGPNASLDLSGSFHASSADYMRLGAGGRFDATNPGASVLTAAPPEAFGFLGPAPAPVIVEGSRLEAAPGQAISLVGGDVVLTLAHPNLASALRTRGGDIRLVGIASAGEVGLDPSATPSAGATLGRVDLVSADVIADSAPGLAPGRIVIRGGQIYAAGNISSANTESTPAGTIAIQAQDSITLGRRIVSSASGDGAGASIHIDAGAGISNGGSSGRVQLAATTRGAGRGGDIVLTAPAIQLGQLSSVETAASASGASGNVRIAGGQIKIEGVVSSTSEAIGSAGSIVIAGDSIDLNPTASGTALSLSTRTSGDANGGDISVVSSATLRITGALIESATSGSGQGGAITLEAPQIDLDRARIESSAMGVGTGGAITLQAPEVTLAGTRIESRAGSDGAGGSIHIDATNVNLRQGSSVATVTDAFATGQGGSIAIDATGRLSIQGAIPGEPAFLSATEGAGNGGEVAIQAHRFEMGPAAVAATRASGDGSGGGISISASQIALDRAQIESIASAGGAGGAITLTGSVSIDLVGDPLRGVPGLVSTSAQGTGAGGDVTLTTPVLTLDGGLIRTTGSPGAAGRITIDADTLIRRNGGSAEQNARGHIAMDGSLGAAVDLPGPDFVVGEELGRLFGTNLFHSFSAFDLLAGESATFTGSDGIANVISRVTGPKFSSIDGVVRSTIPGAHLYFINPRGILFGANAMLDLSGSFHASTADAVLFAGGGRFDAAPAASSELSFSSPTAFGFSAAAPMPLTVTGSQLAMAPLQTLTLAGGDLSIRNATLLVQGGDARLVSAAGPGEVALDADARPSAGMSMGALKLDATAVLSESAPDLAAPPGRVVLRGGQVSLAAGSSISSGNAESAAASAITISADSIDISGGSSITSLTFGAGTGASVDLAAQSNLEVRGESFVGALTFAAGNGGDVSVSGSRILITDKSQVFTNSIEAFEESAATGVPGALSVRGDRITVDGSGTLGTANASGGDAGALEVRANESIDVIHGDITSIALGATGSGGNVLLKAPLIRIWPQGFVLSTNDLAEAGGADAGNLRIEGDTIAIAGTVSTETINAGSAGNLVVSGQTLVMPTGELSASTRAQGAGGSVTIEITGRADIGDRDSPDVTAVFGPGFLATIPPAEEFPGFSRIATIKTLTDPASKFTGSDIGGAGGRILIQAGELRLGPTANVSAQAVAGTGAGGTISLQADTLAISGSHIDASTGGSGRGGDVLIVARDVTIGGAAEITTRAGAAGAAAGNIDIRAGEIRVNDAVISAATAGSGSAGEVRLDAPRITLDGARVSSATESAGNAGSVTLRGTRIMLANGASVSTSATSAQGSAGPVSIVGAESIEMSGYDAAGQATSVRSTVFGTGRGGDLLMSAPQLLFDGGVVQSNSFGAGNAGNIELSGERIALVNGGRADAGVTMSGIGGNVDVTASEALSITGRQILSAGAPVMPSGLSSNTTGSGRAGDIRVYARSVRVEQGGTITSSNSSSDSTGAAGNVTVYAQSIAVRTGGEISTATQGPGAGGNIALIASNVEITDGGKVVAGSTGAGNAGNISIVAADAVRVFGGTVTTQAQVSDGGNIDIQAINLVHLRNAEITTSVGSGAGSGGNISIDPTFVIIEHSRLVANAFGGAGGNISIVGDYVFISPDSVIDASSQLGISGSVLISPQRLDPSAALGLLPATYFDASSLLRDTCASRAGPRASTLVNVGRGGMAAAPGATSLSRYFADTAAPFADGVTMGAAPADPPRGPGQRASVLLSSACGG